MTEEQTDEQLRQEAVDRGELPSDDDLRAIAEGRKPKPWRQAFEHPIHGTLVFSMELPDAAKMARHSVAMDNLAAEMGLVDAARGGTMLLLAAIAGLQELVDLPVIATVEEEADDDDGVHVKTRRIYYNPRGELNETWLVNVWLAASAWRSAFIAPQALDRLGKGSGATPGSD